jgi:hypothetical protein
MDDWKPLTIEQADAFRRLGEEVKQRPEEFNADETPKSRRKREWKKLRDLEFTIAIVPDEFSSGKNETLTISKLVDLCANHQESNSKSGSGITQFSLVDDSPKNKGKGAVLDN